MNLDCIVTISHVVDFFKHSHINYVFLNWLQTLFSLLLFILSG